MHYVAFIHTDDAPGFGVSFPDFPGGNVPNDVEKRFGRRCGFDGYAA